MTRLEQIKEWAQQKKNELSSPYQAFILGAVTADNNPDHESFNMRMKLEKEEWLDKAIEWMVDNVFIYRTACPFTDNELIENFKKYMEE